MKKPLLYALLSSLTLFIAACDPASVQPDPTVPTNPATGSKSVLISTKQIVFYDNSILRRIITSNDSLVYQPADYQVSINRLVYQTTLPDGSTVTASGVVYLPNQLNTTHTPYPLLSYQHATAFSEAEAPTGTDFAKVRFSYPIYFATHGYIVACPDYIGYGAAAQLPHDYEHRQSLAQATVDMLLAAKEFLAQKAVDWNSQVFLTGYSEGGYASLAAQKLLENSPNPTLRVAGSSCGAGPYAMSAFFNHVTRQPTGGGVTNHIYAWHTLCYNRIYGLNKPVSYYFKPPYVEQLTKSVANARAIPVSFHQLCTDEFRAELSDPASPFRKALADNDLTNWATQTPTLLIHSEQDEIIPFVTTQQTYASLRERGSPKLNLVALKGGHVPNEVLFMRRSLAWFEQLRN